MKGRAPNLRKTGSQVEVHRNGHPNVWTEVQAFASNDPPIVPVMTKTESAKARETPRKTGSPIRRERRNSNPGRVIGAERTEGVIIVGDGTGAGADCAARITPADPPTRNPGASIVSVATSLRPEFWSELLARVR